MDKGECADCCTITKNRTFQNVVGIINVRNVLILKQDEVEHLIHF